MIRRKLRETSAPKRSNSERLAALRHARGGLTRWETRANEEYEYNLNRVVKNQEWMAKELIVKYLFSGDLIWDNDEINEYIDLAFDPETWKSNPKFKPEINIFNKREGCSFDVEGSSDGFDYMYLTWYMNSPNENNKKEPDVFRIWKDNDGDYSLEFWVKDTSFMYVDDEVYKLYHPNSGILETKVYKSLINCYYNTHSKKENLGNGEEFLEWFEKTLSECRAKMEHLKPLLERTIEKKLDELEAGQA